jgi:pyruvate,water dikinase
MTLAKPRVIALERLRMSDLEEVGGKNASLGEMISQLADAGVRVPGGFATTASAFREFLAHGGLAQRIESSLRNVDIEDVTELARAGAEIRGWLVAAPLPPALEQEIGTAYAALTREAPDATFAVRSSATAEDLPDASFAGQQETFLNISGIDNIIQAIREVFASLYNDRAIAYRVHQGFAHAGVALSAGVQRMVRSDEGAAGVLFTLDTESGFDRVVFITASYGLGEMVVQGAVNPDEFYVDKRNLEAGRPAILRKSVGGKALKMVFGAAQAAGKSTATVEVPKADRHRFSITDAEVEELARYAVIIERHYGRPMDIEWGRDGKLYILQARPETVKSRQDDADRLRRYRLESTSEVKASGRAIGQKIGQGVGIGRRACVPPADSAHGRPGRRHVEPERA